jgi:dTDP-4-amino-4,6-dideoxygalactose transaminase
MRGAITRRGFLAATTAGAAAGRARALVAAPAASGNGAPTVLAGGAAKPALLGGPPVRRAAFASWPVVDEREETALREVLRGGRWYRGDGTIVARFEEAYARLIGARHCIATANGTSALYASLAALDVSPGDEVVLPPYTFVATLNVVFLQYALPVFVDSDPETFQVDARRLEGALTERTAAIVPVHLGGNVCDLDAILEVSRRRRVPVVEDACQAPLAEWRGRKAGTLGDTGCFSFQASKNLNCGEGGAILTSDDDLAARCWAFHDNARGRRGAGYGAAPPGGRGANLRLTEFQAGLLLEQMTRLEGQSRRREENARHLTRRLGAIPGILPARMHEGCTRNACHLYMFRYRPGDFAGLPRARFLEALAAEGVPCSPGYTPLNRQPFIKATLASRAYRRLYPPATLDAWEERNLCPANDRLCEEAVWLTQTMLLGPRPDMDDIADAIEKIRASAAELARS